MIIMCSQYEMQAELMKEFGCVETGLMTRISLT